MTDLSTPDLVDAELAATVSYDVDNDASLCRRYIAAARRKLHFSQSASRGGQSFTDNLQILHQELERAVRWLEVNDTSAPTEAQRLNNPTVTHADFSNFHNYGSPEE